MKSQVCRVLLYIFVLGTALAGYSAWAQDNVQSAVQDGALDIIAAPSVDQSPNCEAAVVNDDGNPENARGLYDPATVWYGQLISMPRYPYHIDKICVGWTRTGSDTDVSFYVEFYDNDGTDGAPSTYLGNFGPFSTTTPVPVWTNYGWYEVPVDITLTHHQVYVVIEWDTEADAGFYVGTDESGGGVRTPGYYWWSTDPGWKNITTIAPNFEAMYIRAGSVDRKAVVIPLF